MLLFDDPSRIDTKLDSRSISYENRHGERGRGGAAERGRKGSPRPKIAPGEKFVLADIKGPGRIRHIWMTFPPGTPEQMRAVWMEIFYDDLPAPSASLPCLDFFCLPHGRTANYYSALTAVQEGRGFNAYFPIAFQRRVRIEVTNSSQRPIDFFYQVDYTLQDVDPGTGYLHVTFRRENPTILKKDFVIADGLEGPGRFLGSSVGIRVLQDGMLWYGEGEFKLYRDGDHELPTICGTGLEDYVGSAWGMTPHTAFYAGVPFQVAPPSQKGSASEPMPDMVSFYRWHLPDPIVFQSSLRATIQQIGFVNIPPGQEHRLQNYVAAGTGWRIGLPEFKGETYAVGLAERRDDYCATAFVYCSRPQAVPRLNVKSAITDIASYDYESNPSTSIPQAPG